VKILLHICCGPCTIYPLRILREEGHDIRGLFFNPNIHPYQEYARRRDTLISFAGQEQLPVILEEGYPLEDFLRQVAFREEERCRICYRIRLSRAAKAARQEGCDAFTATLLYSRYQKHDLIRQVAETVAEAEGIPFFYRDFRAGWSEGVRVSKERAMYRQPYCGCIYSEKERYCPGAGKKGEGAIPA
jgi:predicted adenine nucleotide alpha hydrolase (AANH) superfamily ATPase